MKGFMIEVIVNGRVIKKFYTLAAAKKFARTQTGLVRVDDLKTYKSYVIKTKANPSIKKLEKWTKVKAVRIVKGMLQILK